MKELPKTKHCPPMPKCKPLRKDIIIKVVPQPHEITINFQFYNDKEDK